MLLVSLTGWLAAGTGCQPQPAPTQDPQASVVKLRNDLIDFSKGNLHEVTGRTEAEESYILLYGYDERPLESLPISETLQEKLKAISPGPTEEYVLAHVYGDEIREYAEWECKGSDYHPLLTPTAVITRGDPFRITKEDGNPYWVAMKID